MYTGYNFKKLESAQASRHYKAFRTQYLYIYSIIVKPTDESCISILKISGIFPEAFYNFIVKRPVMN